MQIVRAAPAVAKAGFVPPPLQNQAAANPSSTLNVIVLGQPSYTSATLRDHVRKNLRGSRTPDRVVFRDELPTNATGKVLRREIIEDLEGLQA